MPLPNTIQGIDPFTNKPVQFKDFRAVSRACYKIIEKCVEENERRGKKGDDRFVVCAILNDASKAHRHCWLNLTVHEPEFGILCSRPNRAYAGALSHAENLLSGEWIYANAEQEVKCREIDIEEARVEMSRRAGGQSATAAEVLRGFNRSNSLAQGKRDVRRPSERHGRPFLRRSARRPKPGDC